MWLPRQTRSPIANALVEAIVQRSTVQRSLVSEGVEEVGADNPYLVRDIPC
jgi:hypothetical protein